MTDGDPDDEFCGAGLSLAPFRALRPDVDEARLAGLLSPPYDVIDSARRQALLDRDPDNVVGVILPEPTDEGYATAAELLHRAVEHGLYRLDGTPTLYVYEMSDLDGRATRGLMGAIELRDPDDGVILPHENTMAGPVADRLAVMTATDTDLEPIYLVYDGGGPASQAVRDIDSHDPIAQATTDDGITHRVWAVVDRDVHRAIADDLGQRRGLIADGHHRYATYRERQRIRRADDGKGPWDRGLALLVDSTDYGPQVHAIHRVIPNLSWSGALDKAGESAAIQARDGAPDDVLAETEGLVGFAAVLTDGDRSAVVTDPAGALARASTREGDPAEMTSLDVTIVHRGLIEHTWGLEDTVETVRYAHDTKEAIESARALHGLAILLRPTPVAAVAKVAAVGARMPRKSTLFTPKPASGLLMRRLGDQA